MMAADDVILRVRDTEEGDAGDVALGYPLIDDGGRRKLPAAVGYPLPTEKKEQRLSTSATRQPARDKCASCTMFTQGFLITLGLVWITVISLGMLLHKVPHPLLVLICLPLYPILCGGAVLLLAWCDTPN